MKIKTPGSNINVNFYIDSKEIIEKIEELSVNSINISVDLNLKSSSNSKLRWLRQDDRDFLKVTNSLEQILIPFIDFQNVIFNKKLPNTASQKLKNYIIKRFENPDIYIKPLKPATIKAKLKKGYPIKPGIATQELLNDIKKSKFDISLSFDDSKKKINLP
jgi:hypothetical protein